MHTEPQSLKEMLETIGTAPHITRRLQSAEITPTPDGHEIICDTAWAAACLNRLMPQIRRWLPPNTEVRYHDPSRTEKPAETHTEPDAPEAPPKEEEEQSADNPITRRFAGFEDLRTNFTMLPNAITDEVMAAVNPSVFKLIVATARQTIGRIRDKRTMAATLEWPATHPRIAQVCGMSRTSVIVAIWDARAGGYLVQRALNDEEADRFAKEYGYRPNFGLRLRYHDETADTPNTPRPQYGSKA